MLLYLCGVTQANHRSQYPQYRSPTEYSTRTPEKRKPRTTHELKVHWPSASVLVLRRVSVVYRPSVVRTQKHQPGIWHSQPAFHSPSTFIQSSCLSYREECFHTIRNMQATQQAVHTGKQPHMRVLRLKLIHMSAANTESPASTVCESVCQSQVLIDQYASQPQTNQPSPNSHHAISGRHLHSVYTDTVPACECKPRSITCRAAISPRCSGGVLSARSTTCTESIFTSLTPQNYICYPPH